MAYGDLFRNDIARGLAIGAGLALLMPLAVVALAPAGGIVPAHLEHAQAAR